MFFLWHGQSCKEIVMFETSRNTRDCRMMQRVPEIAPNEAKTRTNSNEAVATASQTPNSP